MAQRSISAIGCATRGRRPNVGSSSTAANPYFPPAASSPATFPTQQPYRFPTSSVSSTTVSQSCHTSTALSIPSLPQDLPLPNAYELAMMEELDQVSDGRWRVRKACGRRLSGDTDWDDWCAGGTRKTSGDSRIIPLHAMHRNGGGPTASDTMQLSPLPMICPRGTSQPSQPEADIQSILSIETADLEEEREAAMEASYARALTQGGFLATLGVRAAKARQIAIERISAVARHFRSMPVTPGLHPAAS